MWRAQNPRPKAKDEKVEVFRIMDLPKELRTQIWELVVVDTKFFVWPDSKTGCEEPDLAKVTRAVREEVLPIYYSKNTFAVDIGSRSGSAISKKRTANSKDAKTGLMPSGLVAIERWAEVLEESGWFRMIRNWAISYYPMTAGFDCEGHSMYEKLEEDESFIASVCFFKKPDSESWGAIVEVHRDAFCMLLGHDAYGLCKVEKVPEWLNDAVISVVDAAKGGMIDGGMILGLAAVIKQRATELTEARCSEVWKTIEGSGGVARRLQVIRGGTCGDWGKHIDDVKLLS